MQITLFSKKRMVFIVKGTTDIYSTRYDRSRKRWICGCKSFKYNKQRDIEYCKHIQKVMEWVQYNKINLE